MSSFVKGLNCGTIDWPTKDTTFMIEDNVGDLHPMHIHIGGGPHIEGWVVRFHFTYEEFLKFCDALEEAGEL